MPESKVLTTYPFPTHIDHVFYHSPTTLLVFLSHPARIHALNLTTLTSTADEKKTTTGENEGDYKVVHEFPATAIHGVATSRKGVIVVLTSSGAWYPEPKPAPGTYKLWLVDLATWDLDNTQPPVSVLADLPIGQWLNGLTIIPPPTSTSSPLNSDPTLRQTTDSLQETLPNPSPTFLTADSLTGTIYTLHPTPNNAHNTLTSFSHPTFLPPSNPQQKQTYAVGINDLHYLATTHTIYVSNAHSGKIYRIPLDPYTNLPLGREPLEVASSQMSRFHSTSTSVFDEPRVGGFCVHDRRRKWKIEDWNAEAETAKKRKKKKHREKGVKPELLVQSGLGIAKVRDRSVRKGRRKMVWEDVTGIGGFELLGGATCIAVGDEFVAEERRSRKKGKKEKAEEMKRKTRVWVAMGGVYIAGVEGWARGGQVVQVEGCW